MSTPMPLPEDLKARIEEINRDLNYTRERGRIVPYLVPNRTPHEWKCRLVDKDENTLVDHLQWQHLERHTVSMVLYGFEEQAARQFRLGQRDAVNKLHEHVQRVLGLTPTI